MGCGKHQLAIALVLIQLGIPALASTSRTDKGVAAYNAGDYAQAVKLLGEAKATDFNNPLLHYYLANSLLKVGSKDVAIKEYKLARDLQPDGEMADYCEAALKKLVPEPPKTVTEPVPKKSALAAPKQEAAEKKPASQKPQVFSYLCGCPLCHRVELMITDLHTKYGDQITFIRTLRNATDSQTQHIIQNYHVSVCPSVLLFDNQGKMIQQYDGVVSEEKICKDLEALAATSEFTRLSGTVDKRLISSRNAIVSEVYARLAADRLRVDNEINELQRSGGRDARVRIEFIKQDFEKRKNEWFNDGEVRLRALGLTGSDSKIGRPDSLGD